MKYFEPEMKVGEHFITELGNVEFVISGKWEHDKWWDYSFINVETGNETSGRVMKQDMIKPITSQEWLEHIKFRTTI